MLQVTSKRLGAPLPKKEIVLPANSDARVWWPLVNLVKIRMYAKPDDIIRFATHGHPVPDRRVEKTDEEWKQLLTPE